MDAMRNSKKALLAGAATGIGLLIFSCGNFSNLAIPETVSVKSDAQYTGALGQKYFDLTERLGREMLDEVSQKAKADVYKYVPDASDKMLKYLLHKDLYEVQIDVGKYIDEMDFDASMNASMDFSREVQLPEVSASTPSIPLVEGMPFPADIPTVTVDMSTLDNSVKSATIKSGSISINASASGATFSIDVFNLSGITKGDGSAFSASDFVDGVLDLANAKLDVATIHSTKKITLSASVSKSGTIVGMGQCSCSISVVELKDAVLDMSSYGGFEMNESTSNKTRISSDMVAYVSSMDFGQQEGGLYYKSDANGNVTSARGNGKGIKFKAVNSLPVGNDLELVIKSTTFGIDSTDGIWINGQEKPAAVVASTGTDAANDISFAEFTEIDVTDTAIFGTKTNPGWIKFSVSLSPNQTLKDLRMGTTYKIAISDMEALLDWDRVGLMLDSLDPVDDQSDLSDFSIDEMLKEIDNAEVKKLIDHSALDSLPVYFLVQRPTGALADLVDGITFDGKIFLSYKDSTSATETVDIVGSGGMPENLEFCNAMAWPSNDEVVTKKFETKGTDFSFDTDIAFVLNDRATDLKVNYNISVTGGTAVDLYKARLDEMSSSDTCEIAVEMAAVLPLKFKTTADTSLDIYEMAKLDDLKSKADLMDRSDVSKTEDYEKAANSIKYLRLNYNLINSALNGLDAAIELDDTHDGDPKYSGIKKTVNFTANNALDDYIEFDREEIKALLTHFFKPAMTIKIADAQTITVLRDAADSPTSFGINPVVELKLDENSPVNIKDLIKK